MSPESLSHIGRNLLNRKTFLNKTTGSLGFLGLSHLLNQDTYSHCEDVIVPKKLI